jgi:hypothetical protein
VAIVIISCAICFVLGGSIGVLLGAICAMASDKSRQEEAKSSVGKPSILLPGMLLSFNGRRPANS